MMPVIDSREIGHDIQMNTRWSIMLELVRSNHRKNGGVPLRKSVYMVQAVCNGYGKLLGRFRTLHEAREFFTEYQENQPW